MTCDIKLNRDQTYNNMESKFQESDKWLPNIQDLGNWINEDTQQDINKW